MGRDAWLLMVAAMSAAAIFFFLRPTVIPTDHRPAFPPPAPRADPITVTCQCSCPSTPCMCPPSSYQTAGASDQTAGAPIAPGTSAASVNCDLDAPRAIKEPSHADLALWFNYLEKHAAHNAQKVANLISKNGTVSNLTNCVTLDIGTNVGAYSYTLLKALPQCSVLAFEAIPWYASFALSKIQESSDAARFEMYSTALSNVDGTAEILVGLDANKGWNSLFHEKKYGNMAPLCISTTRFATWKRNSHRILPYPLAIKIDTEGAEGVVLNGMREWLAEMPVKPIILVELAWGSSHPDWQRVKDELEYLFSIGYARFDVAAVSGTSDWVLTTEQSYVT